MKNALRALVCVSALLTLGPPAAADFAFTVNSTLDRVDLDVNDGECLTAAGTCTLRAAVMQANQIPNPGATIVLPAGLYFLTRLPTGANGDDVGDLNFATPAAGSPVIAIVGAGAETTIIDGNLIDRIITVHSQRTVTIAGVTIRGGLRAAGNGGGILVFGKLTVTLSTITGNAAGNFGGGLTNSGTVTLDRTTVSGNSADRGGGGIRNYGVALLDRCTISSNVSVLGGGILNSSELLTISNSTIALNDALGEGGGIYNNGSANVYNSSIVRNQADSDGDLDGRGGGFYSDAASTFNIRNSVIAGNYRSQAPIYTDCFGALGSYGRNKLWTVDGCQATHFGPGDITLLTSLAELGALQDNGGPTATVAIVAPSGLIDGAEPIVGCIGGNSAPLATDQRGVPRSVGAGCDIGAFEFGAATPFFADGFETGDLSAWSP
jgi:hypothetical protein